MRTNWSPTISRQTGRPARRPELHRNNRQQRQPTDTSMRLNPFKNIRLATQMYALVGVALLVATGLSFYAMHAVRSTQGTLKYTVDNRMVSGQSIQGVADA